MRSASERRWGHGRRDVWVQFLLESALVTVAGGLLALVVAAVALGVISRFMEISSIMPWEAAFLGLGAAVVVGLLAGVVPARRLRVWTPSRR